MPHVVGLDLSLTNAGIAEVHPSGEIAHRLESSQPAQHVTLATTTDRLVDLAQRVIAHASDADLVVIESPAFSRNSGMAAERHGLWWLVVASLHAAGVPIVEVKPNTLKVYATGTGKADKDVMVANVVRRWGHLAPHLANNNEVDAVVLASMGAHHLGYPPVALPQDHTRAVAAVKWPLAITNTPGVNTHG